MSLSFSIFEGPCCTSCDGHDAGETLGILSRFEREDYPGGEGYPQTYDIPNDPVPSFDPPVTVPPPLDPNYIPEPYVPLPVETPPPHNYGPNTTVEYWAPALPPPVYLEILNSQTAATNPAAPVPQVPVFYSGPQSPPFNPGMSPVVPVPAKQTPLPADDGKNADGTIKVLGFEMDSTTILIGGAVAVAAVVLLAGD